MKTKSLLFYFLMLSGFFACQSKQFNTGEDIIKAIYQRNHDKFLSTWAFEQKVQYFPSKDKDSTEIWVELYKYPNQLLIKKHHFSSGEGMIFKNDSVFYFNNDTLSGSNEQIHYLVVLSLDANHQEPTITMKKLKKAGFDIDKMHLSNWKGRETYVIGATKDDTLSNQLWLDKKHLYVVRTIFNRKNGQRREIHLNNYTLLENSWVEQEVVFMLDGKIEMVETYQNMRIPANIPDSFFTIKGFPIAKW